MEKINCALRLKRQVAGVRFLFDEEAFDSANAPALTARMPYCVMVKRAMGGHSIKAVLDNFGCRASARALGIIPPDELFSSGRHYNNLELYQDLAVSKNIQQNMTLCRHQAYGIMVKPLASFSSPPDVVLVVVSPFQAMRIIQAFTYHFGYHTDFRMAGNQALCSECTAHPFENNTINVSMLCAGTRFMAGWGDDELAVGFPFNKFEPIVAGLYATLNPVEPDKKKKVIEARFAEYPQAAIDIQYKQNYYTGLYRTQPTRHEQSH